MSKTKSTLLVDIKETFLIHTMIKLVEKGRENIPADHLDLKQVRQLIMTHVKRTAETEGKKITREQLDELTEELVEYHKGILKGLSIMDNLRISGHVS